MAKTKINQLLTMDFASLGLSEPLLKAISAQNFTAPYPIQAQAIPEILAGKDVLGAAQTGSGKTASFVLPILEIFLRKKIMRHFHLKVLILVPTRELAVQINEVIGDFVLKIPMSLKHAEIVGGVSQNAQLAALKDAEIVVATPGRLLDLVGSKFIDLSRIEMLVLDEADKMLDLGFKDEIEKILALLPLHRQNILFSATLDTKIDSLKANWLNEAVKIEVEPEEDHTDLITQTAYSVDASRKGPLLRYLIKTREMKQVLVFMSSIRAADNLVIKLKKNGVQAIAIHSNKGQNSRMEALRTFKAGKVNVLVATDLASRGIDIQFLPFVINYELPRSPKDYVHRIGRTGRAEASGEAITFVTPEDAHHFQVIQKKMKKQIELIKTDELELKGF